MESKARRRLVVGGNGFVGTRVVRHALAHGLKVASISRSGAPLVADATIADADWKRGDVTDPAVLKQALEGVDAVVSCLGAFGSQDFMRRINGDANVAVFGAAAVAEVSKAAFISAAVFRPVAPLVRGYYEGKAAAEEAVRAF
eukprot:gene9686-3260_t